MVHTVVAYATMAWPLEHRLVSWIRNAMWAVGSLSILFLPLIECSRFSKTTVCHASACSCMVGCVEEECYLVDPASSHMLVSKIKPCMCKYEQNSDCETAKWLIKSVIVCFDGICYSDNRSNSRANTCNKPRLLEGMHLLDKRSTRALPVAAMIHDNSTDRTALVPATHHSNFCPYQLSMVGSVAYYVKKLVVGLWVWGRPVRLQVCTGLLVPSVGDAAPGLNWPGRASGAVTLKKLECSKQAYALSVMPLECSGPHARYTDVFNEYIAMADRPGKSLKFHRDGDRSLQ
ncbi:hypothetical protein L2E82_52538 [Cichorium intybus]|nr:hypothetical protein L2E82_52538 [Cichorium intybus]